jgi:predicted PurR-regulated permease PerM
MAAAERPGRSERLRVSTRSIAVLVGLIGLTLLILRMVSAAGRVLGWMLVATALAGLIHPGVQRLQDRGWPRGRAVLLVAALGLLLVGLTTYRVVDDVQRGTKRLQRAAPEAARQVEESGRFSDAARSVHLTERTDAFVRRLPGRLRGGSASDALRAAATRGVAFLTTSVLTLFLLLHGPRLARAGLDQIADERRRKRVARVAETAYVRAFGYARGTLLMAALAGWVAYAAAMAANVPGAAPLALWVALWDVVPIAGAFIGAAPIVVLVAVADPVRGILLGLVFLAYQLFEDLAMQPRLERTTMRLGPFLTVAAGFAGIELRGLPGALLAVLAVATVTAALDELTEDELTEIEQPG